MINVAGKKIIQYEKELDESNQLLKSFEKYIGNDKIKKDVSNKVYGFNI